MSLVVQNVHQEYPTRTGPLVVLADVSLTLEPGEVLAIMGPSGAGKSTLLHILGVLEKPTKGQVTLDEQDPYLLSDDAQAAFRNQRIGFIFQDHYLLPQCTALENVLVPTLVSPAAMGDHEPRARALLSRVGLTERLGHRPAELSGGERQRVAVARALVNNPAVLLADEPTGNLDRRSAEAIGGLLLELSKQEHTILVTVTHSPELARRFPKRAELVDGTLKPLK